MIAIPMKFGSKDFICFLHENRFCMAKPSGFIIECNKSGSETNPKILNFGSPDFPIKIKYFFRFQDGKEGIWKYEIDCFATKKELIDSF